MTFALPILLKHTGNLFLYRNPNGSLFGLCNGKRVVVDFALKHLPVQGVERAKQLLADCSLSFDGLRLRINPLLRGGGSCFSRQNSTTVPLSEMENRKGSLPSVVSTVVKTERLAEENLEIVSAAVAIEEQIPGWRIPRKNPDFVGRVALLAEIGRKLRENTSISQVAIAGMGGVGKTGLVTEYLHRNRNNYKTAWWISGENPAADYRDLGVSLGIVQPTDKGDVVLEVVKNWLETNSNWILVFDNVEDQQKIAPYLPSTGKMGHILTTSRNPHTQNCLRVDLFSMDESTHLLSLLTNQPISDQTGKLAEALGHLPLALAQAGAYMRETKTSDADYLLIFSEERKALWTDETAPKDYPATVGTTWNVSVKRIGQEMPEALELLYLSAYLAPDNIPSFLFSTEGQDDLLLVKGLHKLQAYSLFTLGQKEDTYSVHRLVQASTQDNITPSKQKALLQLLQVRLKKEWDFDSEKPSTWPKGKLLLEHLAAFVKNGESDGEFSLSIAIFLSGLGQWSGLIEVNPQLAVELHTRSLEFFKKVCGEEHIFVASSHNNLGMAYARLGQLSTAIEHCTEALQISTGLEENNPIIISSLNSLGIFYAESGNLPLAIEHLTKALRSARKVYPEKHVSVAACLNSLGSAHADHGELSKAIDYYKEALAIQEALYQDDHPDVANTLNNLGTLYRDLKEFTVALEYCSRSLEINRKLYGEAHPSVATSLNNLSGVYQHQKNYPESIKLLFEALEIDRKTYPEIHPKVATVLSNLGLNYAESGDLEKGIDFHLQALAIWEAVYGSDHLTVVGELKAIAEIYESKEDLDEAIEYLEKALTIQRKTQNKDDPYLTNTLAMLGRIYRAKGDVQKAVDYYTEAFGAERIKKSLIGEDHSTFAAALSDPVAKRAMMSHPMDPKMSLLLLSRLTKLTPSEEMRSLAEMLGHIPLAVTIAAAYIDLNKTTVGLYNALFYMERSKFLQGKPATIDFQTTVGIATNISINWIQNERPAALEPLYISSFLNSDNIPGSLYSPDGQPLPHLPLSLSTLAVYDLLKAGQEEGTYSSHHLVQSTCRDRFNPSQRKNLLNTLLSRLKREWKFNSGDPSTWPKVKPFVEHIKTCIQYAESEQELLPTVAFFSWQPRTMAFSRRDRLLFCAGIFQPST